MTPAKRLLGLLGPTAGLAVFTGQIAVLLDAAALAFTRRGRLTMRPPSGGAGPGARLPEAGTAVARSAHSATASHGAHPDSERCP